MRQPDLFPLPVATRVCTKCGVEKTTDNFHRRNGSPVGFQASCKLCCKSRDAKFRALNRDKISAWHKQHRAKKKALGLTKDYSAEWRVKNPEQYLASRRARQEKNPDKAASTHIFRRYGLTRDEWDDIFERQGGACAICGGTETARGRLSVDHDHSVDLDVGLTADAKKASVRGLLCHKCNSGLGHFCESQEIMESAIAYIVYWKKIRSEQVSGN